jgi:hypothetical protein
LQHLLEVESRKLYLAEGYPSLYQYAIEVLKYSEAQAFRRISAMRLMKEIPEIKTSIEEGTIQLTHLTQAQQYFKHKAKESECLNKNKKVEILESLKNKTTRETETIFAALNPDPVTRDKTRIITATQTEIRFVASNTLLEKLARFKELDSHAIGDANYNELFERLVDLALRQKEKIHSVQTTDSEDGVAKTSAPKVIPAKTNPSHPSHKVRSRYIPIDIKREVLKRDGGMCTFMNPLTKKRCNSKHFLQFEHKIPFANGGTHSIENITLLCRNHNLFQAEKVFGKVKTESFRVIHHHH